MILHEDAFLIDTGTRNEVAPKDKNTAVGDSEHVTEKNVSFTSSWRDDATSLTTCGVLSTIDSSWSADNGHAHNEYVHESESGYSINSGYSYVISSGRSTLQENYSKRHYGQSTLQENYSKRHYSTNNPTKRRPFCSVVSSIDSYPEADRSQNTFRSNVQQGSTPVFDRLYECSSKKQLEGKKRREELWKKNNEMKMKRNGEWGTD